MEKCAEPKRLKKKSKRNTTWFNAPDSRAVKTNNGKRLSWLITMIQPCHSSHHYLNCSHDFLDSSRHFSGSFDDFFEAVPTTFVDNSQEILDSSQVLDSSHVLFQIVPISFLKKITYLLQKASSHFFQTVLIFKTLLVFKRLLVNSCFFFFFFSHSRFHHFMKGIKLLFLSGACLKTFFQFPKNSVTSTC